ncbi:MAG: DNA polymerase III subunit gamma/tau [Akkermansia sp.]
MSYQVFARKYRPRTFADVLGQEHVVRTLCNAIEQKRLAHAYLFVGPRGTGKTSTARIFAKALNCTGGPRVDFDPDEDICREIAEGRSLDVLEIDGASNRGIDNIRDLRDNVQFAPARGQYRIIYIDEVHMLTKESFNALLKTLEEPPAHVMFIFATTEPHKILPTILSRCQRFDLRPIPADTIAGHLVYIAQLEGVSLSEAAAFAIARVADGGMRDAQSMLDQLVSFCGNKIEEAQVNDIFGVTSRETVARALDALLGRRLPELLHLIHELAEAGRDMGQMLAELMSALRELLVVKVAPDEAALSLPPEWRERLTAQLTRCPADKLMRLMEILATAEERLHRSTNKRLHLEMGLIQAVHALSEANISDIIRALNGAPLPPETLPAPAAAEPPLPPAPAPAPAPRSADLQVLDDAPPSFAAPAAPAAAEAPTEAPAPAETPAPVGAQPFTPALWERLLERLHELAPLKADMLGHTLFVEENEGRLVIAVHPQDTDTRDALLGEGLRELLPSLAQELCGHPVSLHVVTEDTLPPPEAMEPPPPLPLPQAAPKAPAPKTAPKPAAEKNDKAEAPASLRPTEEEFYHDPLVELALKEFHATLLRQTDS